MWQIYLLDISQNITKLGAAFICISLVTAFIGGMIFTDSNFSNRDSESFNEKRTISGYLFIASLLLFVFGVLMVTLTPSGDTAREMISNILLSK